MSNRRSILIDADVVSHFLVAGEGQALPQIFPDFPLLMLDKVHQELQCWPNASKLLAELSILMSKKRIRLIPFPEDNPELVREYAHIKTALFKGDGESACLAYVRFHNQVLASSNLRDIRHYCSMHGIDYLTTMDFLCEAKRIGLFDLARCNAFLQCVKAAGSRLPVERMEGYGCRELGFMM